MPGRGPLIGILGGMGPMATAEFMRQLVRLKDAARDQDHCRSLVYSDPTLPDRSHAILNQGPSPRTGLLDGIALLNRCGVDAIAIPCNTAHYWLDELAAASGAPIISIVDAVLEQIGRKAPGAKRIGILGTRGTLHSGIYQQGLVRCGLDFVGPTESEQSLLVEPAIRAVKAGDIDKAGPSIRLAIETMEARGAAAVVLGCTELPLAVTTTVSARGTPIIDSTQALAGACLGWAEAFADRTIGDPRLSRAA